MRILMLVHHVPGGGGSFERAMALARQLARQGHAVTLGASPARLRTTLHVHDWHGVRVVEMPDAAPFRLRNMGLSPLDILGRMQLAAHERFDVIHGFDQRPCVAWPALVQRRRFGTPYISDWADLWGRPGIAAERAWPLRITLGAFDGAWEQRICRAADGLTPICTDLAERARAFGTPAQRIHLLPVGADCGDRPPAEKSASRAALALPARRPMAVHLGLGTYDLPLLEQAFIAMAQLEPRAVLVTSGRRSPRLARTARRLGLEDNLCQLGWIAQEQLPTLVAAADLMLLPYTRRPVNVGRSPNSAGHAMAAARPIVTNDTGDLGKLVGDEHIGVTAAEDGPAMARAMQMLFGDAARAEAMGRRARRLAETRLSWSILAGDLAEFYMRCSRR
jgi:glycosyltransferase involved in cell wall biosynthesis